MSTLSPPKRPRLSLQIKSLTTGPNIRSSRTLAAVTNPRSPTSFNTLTNVYSTAIDRSAVTPMPMPNTAEPITAIHMNDKRLPDQPYLQMPSALTPYISTQFPETPLTAKPMSPAVAMEMRFPSTMTSTPPLSAGPLDTHNGMKQVFGFSPDDIQRHSQQFQFANDPRNAVTSDDCKAKAAVPGLDDKDTAITDSCSESSYAASDCSVDGLQLDLHSSPPRAQRPTLVMSTATTPITAISSHRRAAIPGLMIPSKPSKPAPYIRNRALHSILRNSPLPPNTAATPTSPRRQSQRLIDKANRHVMYNNPLTQTITTNLYTRSHVDLLCDEASPFQSPSTASPSGSGNSADRMLDLTMAYTGNETRDGGTTPGPFEEMRRRMAGLGTHSAGNSTATTPISPGGGLASPRSSGGIRKKKASSSSKKDRKRRWVWTLGQDDEEEATLSGAMIALKAAQKAEEEAKARGQLQAEVQAELQADDVMTPLAVQVQSALPEPSQDVEMQDSEPTPETTKTLATARKRKSTPTPYATDSESDAGAEEEADFDLDMQTPTTVQLQGAWLRAASASASAASSSSTGVHTQSRLRNAFES